MSIAARAIALNGVGFGPRSVALLGLVPVFTNPEPQAPGWVAFGGGAHLALRRKAVRRQNEALLLTLLK